MHTVGLGYHRICRYASTHKAKYAEVDLTGFGSASIAADACCAFLANNAAAPVCVLVSLTKACASLAVLLIRLVVTGCTTQCLYQVSQGHLILILLCISTRGNRGRSYCLSWLSHCKINVFARDMVECSILCC